MRRTKHTASPAFPGLAVLALLFTFIIGSGVIPGPVTAAENTAVMVPQSFSALARAASPAVVNISTEKTVNGGGRVFNHYFKGPRGQQDQFQNFFDQFLQNMPQRDFKQKSLGSGFILDKEGYIVTNNHVIENADTIQVKLKDGKEYEAKIIGSDPSTDLALIRIEADYDLPALTLGDSDTLDVGQWVMAIGNPFGLENTVTSGIVSAKGRVIGAGPYDDFIQTDASINPGNSGGPLLDMNGAVVGINTAIIAGGEGIGFAIPVNMAKTIFDQLRADGEVTRGWIGVGIQSLDKSLKEYYGVDKGVLVAEVFPGEPADKAGILANDIILSVNGKPVDSSRELSQGVSGLSVGEKAVLKVRRDGDTKTIKVTVSRRDEAALAAGGGPAKKETADALGIQVADLTPEISRRYGIDTTGVFVAGVQPDGPAAKAGLRNGDIIMEINHKPVKTSSDYARIVKGFEKGKPVQLYIRRAGQGFLVITVAK